MTDDDRGWDWTGVDVRCWPSRPMLSFIGLLLPQIGDSGAMWLPIGITMTAGSGCEDLSINDRNRLQWSHISPLAPPICSVRANCAMQASSETSPWSSCGSAIGTGRMWNSCVEMATRWHESHSRMSTICPMNKSLTAEEFVLQCRYQSISDTAFSDPIYRAVFLPSAVSIWNTDKFSHKSESKAVHTTVTVFLTHHSSMLFPILYIHTVVLQCSDTIGPVGRQEGQLGKW